MEAGGTTLPQLGPVSEGGGERRSRASGSRSTSSQPYSARLARDDRSNYLAREEENVRAVYKKHAQSFFEEVKDGFLKEAVALRKQAQKAFAKSGVPWDAPDVAGNSEGSEAAGTAPMVAGLQAQLLALQRQVDEMQVTFSTRQGGQLHAPSPVESENLKECAGSSAAQSRLAGRSPSPSPGIGGSGGTASGVVALSEKLARQQDEIKALSRLVKTELSAAKKAVLTPMWKERALQEIAQGELRAVCADEVSKAFRDFASAFSEREAEAAVTRLCESGATPMESRLRAEMEVVRKELSRQIVELFGLTGVLSDRLSDAEDRQAVHSSELTTMQGHQAAQAADLVHTEANLRSMHHEGLGGLHKHFDTLSERLGCAVTKIDSVEAKCTALHASLSNSLQMSVSEEASQRQSGIARVAGDLDVLRLRVEEEHRQLSQQMSNASASCADACTRVAEVQRSTKDDIQSCSQALSSTQQAAKASQQAAEVATTRAEASQRLAEEIAAEARGARAGVDRASSAAETARADATAARRVADRAAEDASAARQLADRTAEVAAQGERSIGQHRTRLSSAEERLDILQRNAERLDDRIRVHASDIEECWANDRRICAEMQAVAASCKAQELQLGALSEWVAETAASAAAAPVLAPANAVSTECPQSTMASGSCSSYDGHADLQKSSRPIFQHQLTEDSSAVKAIADDMASEMIEQTWLSSCGSDVRVRPGAWMDIGADAVSEDSRGPSVASMARSSPESVCEPSWQLFNSMKANK